MSWKEVLLYLVFVCSAAAAIAGGGALIAWEDRPGNSRSAPAFWPEESRIARQPRGKRLLLFAHGRCSCTSATVAELSRAIREAKLGAGELWVTVARYGAGGQEGYSLPTADVFDDDDGGEAKRFGAETSGTAVLYGESGQLLFQGGVTASRGHEGGSRGFEALRLALATGNGAKQIAPVFGCSLMERDGQRK